MVRYLVISTVALVSVDTSQPTFSAEGLDAVLVSTSIDCVSAVCSSLPDMVAKVTREAVGMIPYPYDNSAKPDAKSLTTGSTTSFLADMSQPGPKVWNFRLAQSEVNRMETSPKALAASREAAREGKGNLSETKTLQQLTNELGELKIKVKRLPPPPVPSSQ